MKIWFQNRRTKWKKSENVSEAEVAELRSAAGKRTCNGGSASAQDSTPPQTLPLSQHLFAHGRALQCLASSAPVSNSDVLSPNLNWTQSHGAFAKPYRSPVSVPGPLSEVGSSLKPVTSSEARYTSAAENNDGIIGGKYQSHDESRGNTTAD